MSAVELGAPLPLVASVEACRPFFEARHAELAAHLGRELPQHRAALNGDAARAAHHLGAAGVGLYAHLVPPLRASGAAAAPTGSGAAAAPTGSGAPAAIDVRSLVVVREALAQVSPMADSIFAVQGLGSYPVTAFGSDAQREAVLPGVLSGERIGAVALTEPEAGTDVASLSCAATRDGDGWLLDGDKTLISNVGIAHHYVVFANADKAAGRRGITAFLVDARSDGVVEEPLALSSPHPLGALHFTRCRVPDSARIGAVGQGFAIAMATLDAFRISVGAAANGMAARALELARARVLARKQFGRPLADQQQVQAYLAEMATDLDAARLLVARAAHKKDAAAPGERVTMEAAMAKMFSTEAAQRIIDRAVQLFGGSGVLLGSEVEALYRDIRPLRIYEGTTEIQRVVIARALLDRG